MSNQWILGIVIVVGLILLIGFLISFARRKKRPQKADLNQIYVGNLLYRVSDQDLENFFSRFGKISEVRVVKNSRTGRSRGYGFVTFFDARDAQKALNTHGNDLKGRKLVVRIAKPSKAF